jgi:hypothetical protein
MHLPTVFETCEPREDVLTGSIAEADFAADLAKVIRGTASDDYQIPARFFANTYPTAGLKNLLRNSSRCFMFLPLSALSGTTGLPVISAPAP